MSAPILPLRVPFTDGNGIISREWFWYLDSKDKELDASMPESANQILSQRTFAAADMRSMQDQGILMNQIFGD